MAKSNSFFGLRRGSTKSLTFQILNGKQITKDRVTSVRNPKSNGQIMQRMKMTAVQIFARYFRTYIERGQQGVSYGTKSYQKWLSEALKAPNLYAAKGQTNLMPWALPLTRGSLTPFAYGYTGTVENLLLPTGSDDAAAVTDAMIIASNQQIQDGDQIAVIELLENTDGSMIVKTAKHILNSANAASSSLAADIASQGIEVSDWTPEVNEDETAPTCVRFGYPDTVKGMVGFACILSRQNGSTYERSTQDLAVADSYFSAAFIKAAYDSYRDAEQRTTDWPEIVEEGFIPIKTAGIMLEGETTQGNPTYLKYAYVYGFNGNEFKRYLVGAQGTGGGTATLYTYPQMEINTYVRGVVADANCDGYITMTDYEKIFG